jgi:hypothetical protein
MASGVADSFIIASGAAVSSIIASGVEFDAPQALNSSDTKRIKLNKNWDFFIFSPYESFPHGS